MFSDSSKCDWSFGSNHSNDMEHGANWPESAFGNLILPTGSAYLSRYLHSGSPLSTAGAPQQVLYLQEPGTNNAISPHDINQGSLGDCFLLSAIGEIARVDPNYIRNNLIHSNANGTETVTLYEGANGQPINFNTASFDPVQIGVNNQFDPAAVNSQTTKDTFGGQQEIWPQVIEKAYADLNGGYPSISDGGYDIIAMETLTGQNAQYKPIGSANLNSLKHENSNTIMEFDTKDSSNLGYGLVGDHAYMFDGFTTQNNHTFVKLLNPWGTDEPNLVPWAQMAHNFMGVTIGHV